MAEGAPLLRVYRGNSIEGSNPSLSAIKQATLFRVAFFMVEGEAMMRNLVRKIVRKDDFDVVAFHNARRVQHMEVLHQSRIQLGWLLR